MWAGIPLAIALLAATFWPSRPRGLQIFTGTVVVLTVVAALRIIVTGSRGFAELAYAPQSTAALIILVILGLILLFTEHPIGGLGWWVSDPLVVASLSTALLGLMLSGAKLSLLNGLVTVAIWLAIVVVFGLIHWIIVQITHRTKQVKAEDAELKEYHAAIAEQAPPPTPVAQAEEPVTEPVIEKAVVKAKAPPKKRKAKVPKAKPIRKRIPKPISKRKPKQAKKAKTKKATPRQKKRTRKR